MHCPYCGDNELTSPKSFIVTPELIAVDVVSSAKLVSGHKRRLFAGKGSTANGPERHLGGVDGANAERQH